MVFSACIHTDYHRIVPHNGRELEIALGLVSGVVDRDMPLMAEMYDVVVHRPITGGSDNKERLCQFFQILRPKYMLSPDNSASLRKLLYSAASASVNTRDPFSARNNATFSSGFKVGIHSAARSAPENCSGTKSLRKP